MPRDRSRHPLRRAAWLFGLLVAALVPAGVLAQPIDPLEAIERHNQALFARTAPAVVFVATEKGFGSGFFVSSDGLILTNAHVVGSAKKVKVVLHDGRELSGDVVQKASDDLDLALVRIPLQNTPALSFGDLARLKVGSWVASVGHGRGGIWTFNVGVVSNIYPSGAGRPVLQTQIPLNPGSSGGPVVDRDGRVVGVVTAGLTEANSINFAIKADVCQQAFPELSKGASSLRIRAPASVAVFVDGRHVGVGPEVVVPLSGARVEVMAVIGGRMVKRVVESSAREVVLE